MLDAGLAYEMSSLQLGRSSRSDPRLSGETQTEVHRPLNARAPRTAQQDMNHRCTSFHRTTSATSKRSRHCRATSCCNCSGATAGDDRLRLRALGRSCATTGTHDGLRPSDIRSTADFTRLAPLMDKDQMRAWREQHDDPFCGLLCTDVADISFIGSSSGTTGDPTLFSTAGAATTATCPPAPGLPADGPSSYWGGTLRDWWEIGLRPGEHGIYFGLRMRGPMFRLLQSIGITPVMLGYGPDDLHQFVDLSRRFRPTVFYAMSGVSRRRAAGDRAHDGHRHARRVRQLQGHPVRRRAGRARACARPSSAGGSPARSTTRRASATSATRTIAASTTAAMRGKTSAWPRSSTPRAARRSKATAAASSSSARSSMRSTRCCATAAATSSTCGAALCDAAARMRASRRWVAAATRSSSRGARSCRWTCGARSRTCPRRRAGCSRSSGRSVCWMR